MRKKVRSRRMPARRERRESEAQQPRVLNIARTQLRTTRPTPCDVARSTVSTTVSTTVSATSAAASRTVRAVRRTALIFHSA